MRKLIVSEFISLDGVIQAPGAPDEDTDGGFKHGGWTLPFWHDDIGKHFFALMQGVDALLLGRKTYVEHATAFEPMAPGDPFGDLMNAPIHYVVSKKLDESSWRNTIILDDEPMRAIRELKQGPGGTIALDGSSQLAHALFEHDLVDEVHLLVYPVILGGGKRLFPKDVNAKFELTGTDTYPTGVVGMHYARASA
jgi:dihydrofolate reductase